MRWITQQSRANGEVIEVTKKDSKIMELVRSLRICSARETGTDCMDCDGETCGFYESQPGCIDIMLRQAADALVAAYAIKKGGERNAKANCRNHDPV